MKDKDKKIKGVKAPPPMSGGFDVNGKYHRYFNWQADDDDNVAIEADRMDMECDG